MQPHVHFHAARCGEALQTALALKGLDARVCFHVCCERALHGESSKALLALERLLVGVDADVAHKVTGLLEFLGAIWTAVPADAVLLPDGACTVKIHGGGHRWAERSTPRILFWGIKQLFQEADTISIFKARLETLLSGKAFLPVFSH